MRRRMLFTLGTVMASGAAAAGTLFRHYRRDVKRIAKELEAGSQIADTTVGPIEFGRHGAGDPVLVVHGAGGGFDQGLALGDDLFGPGFSTIAPSRFGYLKTPLPQKASPADQADAHAALLDKLGIDQAVVVGVSAGSPSALEMALRHPGRTRALILIVPRAFAPGTREISAPAESAAMIRTVMAGADFAYWAATKIARRSVVRFLGVPPELEATAAPEDRARVDAIMSHVLPLSRRLPGLENDSRTVIRESPLGRVRVPTLVISCEDDLYGTLPAARHTASGIPGAELLVLPTGGHLLVGRRSEVRSAIGSFLERVGTRRAEAA
jgi:2-hydroxy-6-oxonona-2,4-dienedioate hydrolase